MMYVVQKRDTGKKEWESVEEFFNKQEAILYMEDYANLGNFNLRIKKVEI